jgi:hypothetical protein
MIRFINLGDQIRTGFPYFAFYDTSADAFETFNGNCRWESILQFKRDFVEGQNYSLEHYIDLIPEDWRDWRLQLCTDNSKLIESLLELFNFCKCSVSIEHNPHKDYHESVEEYFIKNDNHHIEPAIFDKMVELNTIIVIQFYPDTAVGSYTIHHYDFKLAVAECMRILYIVAPRA